MIDILITVVVTLLVFGVLIFIHELGHYLVARKFGVGIIEFSIGMGPKLKTWHGKYNDFSIRALPIGGYVNMVGEYEDEDVPPEHIGKATLNSKPVWKRILIVAAGPFMNFVLAFVVMAAVVMTSSVLGTTVVASFFEDSVSDKSGLMVNDEIIEINGKTIHCFQEMAYKIVSDGIEPMDVTVLRNGETVKLTGVTFGTETESGVTVGTQDFRVYSKEKTFGSVIYESFWQSCTTVYMTVDSLVDTFRGRYGIEAVGGPIAIGGQVGEVISQSPGFADAVRNIATLAVFISVSLGVANLLPVPVLDGGRLLLYVIEAIRRKPLPKKFESALMAFFTVLLLLLVIFIAIKDIIGLF